ncbi:unnamed protein product [Brugia pahangi]|uniref:Nucleotidyltransferase, ribonuclease H n=1 Tax=Brugia pahangi TaxID=6280 RepID=A0A0N4TR86_BRUPA|nr:unnamed protein product [Brugia pahangi]
MVKIGIPKEILQPEKLKAGRDIMSMTQEKNVTEQHKKSSSLSQMITVKNICGLSTERHKQEIYKAKMCMTKTEDQCCISNQLVKQRTNDRFGANFETNRRVPGVYVSGSFREKGEKDGINFDIVMQLEIEEGKVRLIKTTEEKNWNCFSKRNRSCGKSNRLSMEGNSKKRVNEALDVVAETTPELCVLAPTEKLIDVSQRSNLQYEFEV